MGCTVATGGGLAVFFVSKEIFRISRALQSANTELSIFSRELGETVSIAYPINRVTGDRIVPHHLKDWVLRRRVTWECFCALVTEQHTPVHFETNNRGHSMAYCHQSPSHCGFSLNLSEARETALLESRYTHVLTRVYHNHHQLMDLHDLVLRVHHDRVAATPNGHAELFPYFEDYCGTPTSSALVQRQRGGAVRTRRQFTAAHNISLQHQIRRPSAPLRLPSVADDAHIELARPSSTEQDVLHSLAEGRGITSYEHIGLLELCGNCQRMFAASALRVHILRCSKD